MRYVKPLRTNSIGVKVLLAYVIGVVVSITIIVLTTCWVMTTQSRYFAGMDAAELTEELTEKLQFDSAGMPTGFNSDVQEFAWMFDSMKQETAYRVLDASGKTVLTSAAGEAFWHTSGAAWREPGRFEFEHSGALIHGTTVPMTHEGKTWYLQFAVSARLHFLIHQGVALPLVGVGIFLFSVVLFFVFSICGYFTLGYTLKPLRKLSESAAAISPRSLHARLVAEKIPSEIAPLVDSFNRVLDRLEHGYRVQQEFLATAAHELKTPLALIRAQIEIQPESDLRHSLLNDVAHMARQVQQLLMLAEVSEEQNYNLAMVDVEGVAKEVVTFLQPMAARAGVKVTITHYTEACWLADRAALFTLLKNLLENAIQHAPRDTDVRIELDTTKITLRDWGPGVTEEQLSQLFVRFWRGAHRRDHGAGLGLSICQEIALAHGWTLTAHRMEPGLCFQLIGHLRTETVADETLVGEPSAGQLQVYL